MVACLPKESIRVDVNIQRAAEQRSELSPRRGFASFGSRHQLTIEPRKGRQRFNRYQRDVCYEASVAAPRLSKSNEP